MMQLTSNITFHNMDCMEYMKSVPDKYFDLAVVDPPYGLNMGNGAGETRGFGKKKKDLYIQKGWDNKKPEETYFKELFRVSKNQIIWGGNYFTDKLYVSRGWIYWRKLMGGNYSDGELAWTSFDVVLKEYTQRSDQGIIRIHPTQKPVDLYKWILKNYSDPSHKIIDTHLGSASSAIAAHNFGIKEFVGIELDSDYFNDSIKRFKQVTAQQVLFKQAI